MDIDTGPGDAVAVSDLVPKIDTVTLATTKELIDANLASVDANPESVDDKLIDNVPLMGSSRTSGGFSRGHSHGNALNHADLGGTDLEILGRAYKGEVFLYVTDQYPRQINFDTLKGESEMVVMVVIVERMALILEKVARKFSFIKSPEFSLYYRKGTKWVALGNFDQAVEDDDECEWGLGTTPDLHILICSYNGPVKVSHDAAPITTSTTSRTSTQTISKPMTSNQLSATNQLTARQLDIMSTLDMDVGLVGLKGSRPSLETTWKRYTTITKAISKVGENDWPRGGKPADGEIIGVYVGKSAFYDQAKVLQHVRVHSDMIEWLERDLDENMEEGATKLWGYYKTTYTLRDLEKWVERMLKERHSDRKGKKKAIQKAESSQMGKRDDEGDDSSSPPRTKKSHKKKSVGGRK